MKNILVAFGLFILMIIGIFISSNAIKLRCTQLQDLNSTLESYIIKENYEGAYDLSLDYRKQWKKTSKFLTIYIHHENLDMMNNESLKLTQYTKAKDKSEALATIHVMKYLIDHIIQHEEVSISNIF